VLLAGYTPLGIVGIAATAAVLLGLALNTLACAVGRPARRPGHRCYSLREAR